MRASSIGAATTRRTTEIGSRLCGGRPGLWEALMDNYERTGSWVDRHLTDVIYEGWVQDHNGIHSDYDDGSWAGGRSRRRGHTASPTRAAT